VVNKKRMNENLQKSNGLYNSQRVLLSLIKKGLSRETAYKIVQNVAMKSWNQNKSFEKLLLEEEKIKKFLSSEDINNIFDINYHFKFIDKIFKKIES
jgi:adenylosuccinate lyase